MFFIFAKDKGNPPRMNATRIQINVTDINDNVPQFVNDLNNFTFTVKEDTPDKESTHLFKVLAVDPDIGENGLVSYTIHHGPASDLLSINKTSGIISMKHSPQIHNCSKRTIKFQVVAYNENNRTRNKRQDITLNIEDVNNQEPQFYNSTLITVTENLVTGGDIHLCINTTTLTTHGQCSPSSLAFDTDCLPEYNTLFYWMNNNDARFKINATTGIISITNGSNLDYDKPHLDRDFKFIIYASDTKYTASTTLTLNILNRRDSLPDFTHDVYQCSVQENEEFLNCSLDVHNIKDIDVGMFKYSVKGGEQFFRYNTTKNGTIVQIQLKSPIDYDNLTKTTFQLNVTAVSNKRIIDSTYAIVNISVLNVNDVRPEFIGSPYTFYVMENEPNVPYFVGNVRVSDVDSPFNLSISNTDKHCTDYLNISGNGDIFALQPFDYENIRQLNCTIIANDTLTDSTQTDLLITIQNINDNVPIFTNVSYEAKLMENSTSATSVVRVDAVDRDGDKLEFKVMNYTGNTFYFTNNTLFVKGLDAEKFVSTNGICFLKIQVSDGNHTQTSSVNITVQDKNDCQPEFLAKSYNVTITDVTRSGTVIASLEAVDRDVDEENRHLTYSIVDHYNDIFSMDMSGRLILKNDSLLKAQNYSFNVKVTDNKFTNQASVFVMVVDTNDHPPKFVQEVYNFTITETNEIGVLVGNISANDKDSGHNGEISFEITAGNQDSVYNISSSGVTNGLATITTIKPVDRETNDKYILFLKAFDHGENPRQNTCTVTINILDVNDNLPEFQGAHPFNVSVKENSPKNTTVFVINATDRDFGDNGTKGIVFKLEEIDGETTPFNISQTKPPAVIVYGDVDRETKAVYHMKIIAFDSLGKSGSLKSTTELTITVNDENDNVPQFSEGIYKFNITENADTIVHIGNVSVTDADLNGIETVRYEITSGAGGKIFVNPVTGLLYAGGGIDRENVRFFSLNVSASDGKNINFTKVEITVIDINDNAPEFEATAIKNSVDVYVVEEDTTGVIFNATAHDLDDVNSENSKVTYSMNVTSEGCMSLFNLTNNGSLKLTEPLDREKCAYYDIIITAKDNGTPSLSSSLFVHVYVQDINDHTPEFCVDGQCNVTFTKSYTIEKAPVSSVLKLIETRDSDAGKNGTVTYSLEPSIVSKYFKIDNVTGVVTIAEPLVVNNLIHIKGMSNKTSTVEINLIILAEDGGGRQANLTLGVVVEPINDEDVPVFTTSVFKFSINETNETGVSVGNCTATTNDTTSHMTYKLISGYDKDLTAFKIDPETGELRTTASLDREMTDKYIFAVQVRDGRVPERTAFASVEITVDDVNDNSPVFEDSNVTISVYENAQIHLEEHVTAHDQDDGVNAELEYTLDDSYGGIFSVDNGVLTLNGTFDYEKKSKYDIVVTATDKGVSPRNGSAEVHVLVKDENDHSPVFASLQQFYNVSENEVSREIFTANATDDDSGLNGQVLYKLLNNEYVPFIIDPFNGTVYLQGQVDYETKNRYTLCIVARDLGTPPKKTTKNVTVYVTDVYDDKLLFSKDIYDIYVSRGAKMNSSLLNLTVGISEASYSLKGQETGYFRIDKVSGEIFLDKPLDAEQELYVLQVIAEDKHGQNTSCTVVVHVTGHQVRFDQPEMKLNVAENRNGTSVLVDLNTTAEFSGSGAVYVIVKISPPEPETGLFTVNSTTGIVSSTKALDREENTQYTILITAHTPDSRRKRDVLTPSSAIKLIIDVDDVNDNPPSFSADQERVFGVPDNVLANYIVGTVTAEDPDSSDIGQLRYMATGYSTDVFGVDERTGSIITLVPIANTRKHRFNLLISALDGNSMHKGAVLNVTIHVVPTKNLPILLVNMTVSEFKKREDVFRRNMSEILGVNVQFEKIESHEIVNSNGRRHIDLARTDLTLHGINRTTGLLVPNRKLKELIDNAIKELASLFGQKVEVKVTVLKVISDPSAITASQILIICMAIFIFIGSLAALVVSQYSWMRYETERQTVEKEAERIERDMELSTIRSRQSSKLSSTIASAASNPGYVETEFNTSNGTLSPKMKAEPQYESQELRVNFKDTFDLNAQIPAESSQSVIDSGVGNASVHSKSTSPEIPSTGSIETEGKETTLQVHDMVLLNGEGPIMTSSPRISREPRPTENEVSSSGTTNDMDKNDGNIVGVIIPETRSRGDSIRLLDATGEDETDDINNENVGEVDVAGKFKNNDITKTIDITELEKTDQPVKVHFDESVNVIDGTSGKDEQVKVFVTEAGDEGDPINEGSKINIKEEGDYADNGPKDEDNFDKECTSF